MRLLDSGKVWTRTVEKQHAFKLAYPCGCACGESGEVKKCGRVHAGVRRVGSARAVDAFTLACGEAAHASERIEQAFGRRGVAAGVGMSA